MSGTQGSSPPGTATTDAAGSNDEEGYHPAFSSATADFVVRSSDGVQFKCHRLFLQEASPVFRTMLSLPQPQTADENHRPPSIDLPEDGKTLEVLLRLIYPMTQPVIDSVATLSTVLFAAEKYDMAGVISVLGMHMRSERFLETHPVHVYALACRFGFAAEAKAASRACLTHNVNDPALLPMLVSTGLKMSDYFALSSLWNQRINGMREFLDGSRFEGNAPDFSCVQCDKKLNDITWPLLKGTILKEMQRRPLGDTIFGPEFLKSNCVHTFINSKCDECGEKQIYEKGRTLSMVAECLKALPDTVTLDWHDQGDTQPATSSHPDDA